MWGQEEKRQGCSRCSVSLALKAALSEHRGTSFACISDGCGGAGMAAKWGAGSGVGGLQQVFGIRCFKDVLKLSTAPIRAQHSHTALTQTSAMQTATHLVQFDVQGPCFRSDVLHTLHTPHPQRPLRIKLFLKLLRIHHPPAPV